MAQPMIGRWKLGKVFLAPSWTQMKAVAAWISNASKARAARHEDKSRPDMFTAFAGAVHPKTGHVFDRKDLFTESMLFMSATSESEVFLPLLHHHLFRPHADPRRHQHMNPWHSA
jgi:hypothetical protein